MKSYECRKCKGLKEDNNSIFCNRCIKEVRDAASIVNTYLSSHKNASVMEISSETGISVKVLNLLLEDGMLYMQRRE